MVRCSCSEMPRSGESSLVGTQAGSPAPHSLLSSDQPEGLAAAGTCTVWRVWHARELPNNHRRLCGRCSATTVFPAFLLSARVSIHTHTHTPVAWVEVCKVIPHGRHGSSLKHSQQHPQRKEARHAVDQGHAGSDCTPAKEQEGKPAPHTHTCHHQVGGDLRHSTQQQASRQSKQAGRQQAGVGCVGQLVAGEFGQQGGAHVLSWLLWLSCWVAQAYSIWVSGPCPWQQLTHLKDTEGYKEQRWTQTGGCRGATRHTILSVGTTAGTSTIA